MTITATSHHELEVVLVGPTPIILAYFAEYNKGTREELTRLVYTASQKMMSETKVRINATFRGDLDNPTGEIWSETVDDELWYWLSNRFIEECSDSENELCLERKKPLDGYKLVNIRKNLKEVQWPSEGDRLQFLDVLEGVITDARS